MLVTILVELVRVAGKELDEYLYRNDELGCYIRDVIAADGKVIIAPDLEILQVVVV